MAGIPPLDCKYTFFIISENSDHIDYLYGERGEGESVEKEGTGVKCKMSFIVTNIIYIINQYHAHGLSSFIPFLISFVSYFKNFVIHYFQCVNYAHLFQPCYSPLGDPEKL